MISFIFGGQHSMGNSWIARHGCDTRLEMDILDVLGRNPKVMISAVETLWRTEGRVLAREVKYSGRGVLVVSLATIWRDSARRGGCLSRKYGRSKGGNEQYRA